MKFSIFQAKTGRNGTTVLAIAALVFGLSACGKSETAPSGQSPELAAGTSALDKSEIVIGYDNTFVPMGFDDAGETKGFDVDLARAFAQANGLQVRFQNIDWDMKEAELNSGKIDAIWNGYSSSPQRLEVVDASIPYLDNAQVIMVLAESAIAKRADLAGKKVGTQASSTGQQAIEADTQFLGSIAGGAPDLYPTYDQALRDLQAGRIEAVVGDSILLEYYAKQNTAQSFRVLSENLGTEQYVVAVRKGDQKFKQALDAFFTKAQSDGTMNKIKGNWFN